MRGILLLSFPTSSLKKIELMFYDRALAPRRSSINGEVLTRRFIEFCGEILCVRCLFVNLSSGRAGASSGENSNYSAFSFI